MASRIRLDMVVIGSVAVDRLGHRIGKGEGIYQSKKVTSFDVTHLNSDKIESNLSVNGIQGRHENALIKSCQMSPHLICL